jgi:hypothetical protein
VHVAVGDRDERRGDPFARQVDEIGVGAGFPAGRLHRERHLEPRGGLAQDPECDR